MGVEPAARKILFVITGLKSGGAEAMLTKLLQRVDRRAFAPIVISLLDEGTYGSRLSAAGVPLHCLRVRGALSGIVGLLRLAWLICREKPTITHGWMYHGNVFATLAFLLSAGRGGTLAWGIRHSVHDIGNEKFAMRVMIRVSALLSRRAEICIYPSVRAQQQHRELGFRCGRDEVIPNGFDIDRYRPPEHDARRNARAQFGLHDAELLVVHLARFHPMKDHAGLLRSAALASSRLPNMRFALAGTNVSMKTPLFRELIEELDLTDRVRLLGELEDVRPLLHAADVFCLCSAWGEAFPNVLGEAMAAGLPCVVTDIGECADVLGEHGYVVAPSDPESLASALERLCQLSAPSRSQVGADARTRVIDRYEINRVVRRYEQLYLSLVC